MDDVGLVLLATIQPKDGIGAGLRGDGDRNLFPKELKVLEAAWRTLRS